MTYDFRHTDLFSCLELYEASAQKYEQMFAKTLQLIFQIDQRRGTNGKRVQAETFSKIIGVNIKWARSILKRDDRIVWFLRWIRLNV